MTPINDSTESCSVQVWTVLCMITATGSDNTVIPSASLWITSRSLTIPVTVAPSSETTTAPRLCSLSRAISSSTVAEGLMTITSDPLCRKIS